MAAAKIFSVFSKGVLTDGCEISKKRNTAKRKKHSEILIPS